MKMNLSSFTSSIFGVLLVLSSEYNIGFSQTDMRNYITWNDISIGNKNKVIVVDKNGGGNSVTVQGAINMVPEYNEERVIIHIRPGVYSERVHIPVSKPYISFIGDQNRASATVISWHYKASDRDKNGGTLGTWNSASVTVESDYFCATWVTFQNTEGKPPYEGAQGSQAVALRIAGDKAMFYKSRFLGSQDTLLDEMGTHYFLQCFIQGSVDFIFGNGRSLYKECTLSLVDAYAIAAQSRGSANEDTGFSFVNCTVSGTGNPLLGRAWGDYSRVIYAYTEFNVDVMPEGWTHWGVPSRANTVVFGEYQCTGRGANRGRQVGWSKGLNYLEAKPFLDSSFISGNQWLRL